MFQSNRVFSSVAVQPFADCKTYSYTQRRRNSELLCGGACSVVATVPCKHSAESATLSISTNFSLSTFQFRPPSVSQHEPRSLRGMRESVARFGGRQFPNNSQNKKGGVSNRKSRGQVQPVFRAVPISASRIGAERVEKYPSPKENSGEPDLSNSGNSRAQATALFPAKWRSPSFFRISRSCGSKAHSLIPHKLGGSLISKTTAFPFTYDCAHFWSIPNNGWIECLWCGRRNQTL